MNINTKHIPDENIETTPNVCKILFFSENKHKFPKINNINVNEILTHIFIYHIFILPLL